MLSNLSCVQLLHKKHLCIFHILFTVCFRFSALNSIYQENLYSARSSRRQHVTRVASLLLGYGWPQASIAYCAPYCFFLLFAVPNQILLCYTDTAAASSCVPSPPNSPGCRSYKQFLQYLQGLWISFLLWDECLLHFKITWLSLRFATLTLYIGRVPSQRQPIPMTTMSKPYSCYNHHIPATAKAQIYFFPCSSFEYYKISGLCLESSHEFCHIPFAAWIITNKYSNYLKSNSNCLFSCFMVFLAVYIIIPTCVGLHMNPIFY